MLVIGIAGGIACGKSLIALEFQRLGAKIIDADRLGHEVLQEAAVLVEIRNSWGESVISGGNIDRKAIAAIVFADGQGLELRRLEAITHPRIGERIYSKISELRSKTELPAVVLDAPVMFKAGWDEFCDKIVFIDVPIEIRRQRAMATRGWSSDELELRERKQIPLDEKMRKSTDIIDNSGTPNHSAKQVRRLWAQWGLDRSNSE